MSKVRRAGPPASDLTTKGAHEAEHISSSVANDTNEVPFPRVHHDGVKNRSGFSKAMQVGLPAAAVLAAAAGGAYYLLEHQATNTVSEPTDRSREDAATDILFEGETPPADRSAREDPSGGTTTTETATVDRSAREDPTAPTGTNTTATPDETVRPTNRISNPRELFHRDMRVNPNGTPGTLRDSTGSNGSHSIVSPTTNGHNEIRR